MVRGTELDPTRQYIFVAPPHGAFPFGNVCSAVAFPTVAGLTVRSLAATAVIRYPIIRQVMSWIGVIDASRQNAYRALLEGESIGICPGGIAEIFETNLVTESLIMRKRKGMVRLALRTGVPLVPCYMFGNSAVLHTFFDPWDIMHTVSMNVKVSMFAFWGRWGLPIPFRTPLLTVVGAPIPVSGTKKPVMKNVFVTTDWMLLFSCLTMHRYPTTPTLTKHWLINFTNSWWIQSRRCSKNTSSSTDGTTRS